jgi:acylpyruvate hydrolase
MRLATVTDPATGSPAAAEIRGEDAVLYRDATVVELLALDEVPAADGDTHPLADLELHAPVPRPRAIFGIGLNYADHARETGQDLPEAPMVFAKLPSSSVHPNGDVHPPAIVFDRLDYEAELAVVMGAGGRIAGYAVADDLSARDLQQAEPRWVRAKGFDQSCPWGPWITTADEVADPKALKITCDVDGERRQDSTTAELVFGPEELVAFISEAITLEPGDLILTGTPSGVGRAMDPPRLLSDGSVVRCEIEGLGAIEHTVRTGR